MGAPHFLVGMSISESTLTCSFCGVLTSPLLHHCRKRLDGEGNCTTEKDKIDSKIAVDLDQKKICFDDKKLR